MEVYKKKETESDIPKLRVYASKASSPDPTIEITSNFRLSLVFPGQHYCQDHPEILHCWFDLNILKNFLRYQRHGTWMLQRCTSCQGTASEPCAAL